MGVRGVTYGFRGAKDKWMHWSFASLGTLDQSRAILRYPLYGQIVRCSDPSRKVSQKSIVVSRISRFPGSLLETEPFLPQTVGSVVRGDIA